MHGLNVRISSEGHKLMSFEQKQTSKAKLKTNTLHVTYTLTLCHSCRFESYYMYSLIVYDLEQKHAWNNKVLNKLKPSQIYEVTENARILT